MAIFSPLPEKMLDARSKDSWNVANHWLATRAAPLGFEIKVIVISEKLQQKRALKNIQLLLQIIMIVGFHISI